MALSLAMAHLRVSEGHPDALFVGSCVSKCSTTDGMPSYHQYDDESEGKDSEECHRAKHPLNAHLGNPGRNEEWYGQPETDTPGIHDSIRFGRTGGETFDDVGVQYGNSNDSRRDQAEHPQSKNHGRVVFV